MITREYIESLRTENGGFLRRDLEKLGVPWPPPKNWMRMVLENRYSNRNLELQIQAEEIYNAYPRKVGKPHAVQRIKRHLKTYGFEFLLSATKQFCECWNGCGRDEIIFCPHPSSWFRDEGFNDDPSTWRRISKKRDGYGMKLMDPRWQKIRLKVFERDNWACLVCGDDKSTLAVHHQIYNSEPWTTPVEYLDTVCEKCHTYIKNISKLLRDKFPQCSFPAKVVTDIAKQSHSKDEFLFKAGVEAPKFLRA